MTSLRRKGVLIPSLLLCLMLMGVFGCTTVRETQPPRTATEQFLISYAVMDAIEEMDLSPLEGKKVYLDTRYFDSIDRDFVIGELRAQIAAAGAMLTTRQNAEVRVEVRSAGIGINKKEILVGIPSFVIPVPSSVPIETPELFVLKNNKQKGLAGIALTAFDMDTGKRIFGTGPAVGVTIKSDWAVFGFGIDEDVKQLPEELQY